MVIRSIVITVIFIIILLVIWISYALIMSHIVRSITESARAEIVYIIENDNGQ